MGEFNENTSIKVGYIHNKRGDCLEDVIRVEIVGAYGDVVFDCRLDEAVTLCAGLNKVAARMLVGQLPIPAGGK